MASDTDLAAQVQQILDALKAGAFDDPEAARSLLANLGVRPEEIERLLSEGAEIASVEPTSPQPLPQIVDQTRARQLAETSPNLGVRELLLQEQPPGDVFRRFLEESVGLSGLAGPARAAFQGPQGRRAGDLFSQADIIGFGGGEENPEQTFAEFLRGGRPTSGALTSGLQNIQQLLGGGGGGGTLRERFSDPESVFRASIQPGLTSVAPRLRGSFTAGAGNFFNTLRSTNPELFATPESGFEQFRRRGFF